MYSASQGIPLGAQADPQDYKVLFVDVGLAQAMLSLNLSDWLTHPTATFINKGSIVEAFVGQELIAYHTPTEKAELYYWHRKKRGGEAEIDYIVQANSHALPIEVKSGPGTTLRSLQSFLESHPNTTHGLRFSTNTFSIFESIHSYPLYAIAKAIALDPMVKESINYLIEQPR